MGAMFVSLDGCQAALSGLWFTVWGSALWGLAHRLLSRECGQVRPYRNEIQAQSTESQVKGLQPEWFIV